MRVLVTGFTPFGGEQINPSWEAVKRLPERIGEMTITKREIPTEFDAACAALRAAMDELRPDAVLSVGQYGGANCIRVVPGAPDAYFATLPTRRIVEKLRGEDIPAQLSYSAGTFVCNNLLFCALHESTQKFPAARCGFVHVPYLPEQAKDGSAPSMSLALMVKALTAALKTIAEG